MYLATVPGCCTKKAVGYAIGATTRGTDSVMRGDRYGGPQVPAHDRRAGIPPQAGGASTPPSNSPSIWGDMRSTLPRAGPECAGRVPGRKSAGATLKEREGLSDGPPPQEARPSGILPPRSSPVHTIRNNSTPPWGTGRRARPTRSTEQQDKQPETPLSGLSETRPAVQSRPSRPPAPPPSTTSTSPPPTTTTSTPPPTNPSSSTTTPDQKRKDSTPATHQAQET